METRNGQKQHSFVTSEIWVEEIYENKMHLKGQF